MKDSQIYTGHMHGMGSDTKMCPECSGVPGWNINFCFTCRKTESMKSLMIKESVITPYECRFPLTQSGNIETGFRFKQMDGTPFSPPPGVEFPTSYVKYVVNLGDLTDPEQFYLMNRMADVEKRLNQIRDLALAPQVYYIGKRDA